MKHILTYLLMLPALLSHSQTIFEQHYGGGSDENGYSIKQIGSDGYVAFGWTQSSGAGSADFYLIRLENDGTVRWSQTYGGLDSESGLSVEATADGGFILGGTTRSKGNGGADFWIIKTDMNGNTIFENNFGGSGDDYCREIKTTSDGGFVCVGFTNSVGAGLKDLYVVKTDANGAKTWDGYFGGTADEEGWSVCETADGYALAGWTQSFGNGMSDYYLVKINLNGVYQWSYTYGGGQSDSGLRILQDTDGGFLFAGTTRSIGAGSGDFWLIKTDNTGSQLWNKTYGGAGDDYARSICITSTGYALAGYSNSSGTNGGKDLYLVIADHNGNLISDEFFGGTADDEGWGIAANDSMLIMIGHTMSFTNGGNDMYVVSYQYKQSTSAIDELGETPELLVFPNPASSVVTIQNLSASTDFKMQVINGEGKVVHSEQVIKTSADGKLEWQPNGLPGGKYVIILSSSDEFLKIDLFIHE